MSVKYYKGLVLILDGLGDRPCPILNNLTPLQDAVTPCLDNLVRLGQGGLMDPLVPGLPVDTHTGVAMIFGLPPRDAMKLTRGPIEAAGIDLDLQHGDVLLRCNFATIQPSGDGYKILDRRAERIREGVELLCKSLQDIPLSSGVTASLFPSTQHRTVLRLRGQGLTEQITDTDPGGKYIDRGVLRAEPRINTASDERIFLRSFATRGSGQEVAAATKDAIKLLRSQDFDFIIVDSIAPHI